MSISLAEDIRSVTDLKRHTREQLKAMNIARLLSEGEAQIATGQTRPARAFLDEFHS